MNFLIYNNSKYSNNTSETSRKFMLWHCSRISSYTSNKNLKFVMKRSLAGSYHFCIQITDEKDDKRFVLQNKNALRDVAWVIIWSLDTAVFHVIWVSHVLGRHSVVRIVFPCRPFKDKMQSPKLRLPGRQCDWKFSPGDQNFKAGRQLATCKAGWYCGL